MSLVPTTAGPAESLFKESYYQLMKTALKDDGVLCCQGEQAGVGGGAGVLQCWGALPAGADTALLSPQVSASGCTWTSSRR